MSMNSMVEEMMEEDKILERLGNMKKKVLAGPKRKPEITACHKCNCDDLFIEIGKIEKDKSRSTIECKSCEFKVSGYYNEEQVIEAWNRQ